MRIYHIIDHNGFGSIHKLLIPLCEEYSNNILYTQYLKKYRLTKEAIQKINNDKNSIVIIHSTGRDKTIYIDQLDKYFDNKKIFIFMHVSINYEVFKKREDFIARLYNICKEKHILILTPSKEVTNQYLKYGFDAKTIQIGIRNLNGDYYRKNIKRLEKYYNKFVTVCASESPAYYDAKGISNFIKLAKNEKITNNILVAGVNSYVKKNNDVSMKKFNEDDFLNVLYHSKAYIQLSIFESYNITAIQSKRFKIPTILLSAEGNESCMMGNTFRNINEICYKIREVNNNLIDNKIIKELYNDSIIRESLSRFNSDLIKMTKEV